MRSYELMFIVVPTASEEEVDKVVAQLEGVIKSDQQGTVEVEKLGKKKLAYRIGKFEEGVYVLLKMSASGALVKELERRMKVTDTVLRYVTVRVDERFKRVDKIKANRLSRAQRKAPAGSQDAAGSTI
jgi:small subunit ribosomal protein S6